MRGLRRKTSWSLGPHSGTAGSPQSITASGASLATTNVNVLADGVTLIRTRGELVFSLILADAASAGFHGAFGIGIATQAAIAAGVTAVPTPITEQDAENC